MDARPQPSARGRWLAVAVAACLGVLAVSAGLQKIRSFDYWWQLRVGAEIAETGRVPDRDTYSYTATGERYVDMHWLFQLGLHGLYEAGGHGAVVAARGVIVAALLAVLVSIGWRRERALLAGLSAALALHVMHLRLLARPELVSFLLLACVLALLFRHERRGGRGVYAVVGIQLLWVNVHGLYALGIAALGMALASEILRPVLHASQSLRRDRVVPLGAVLVLSLLASLASPHGLEAVRFTFEQLGMIQGEARGPFGLAIQELQPTLLVGPTLPARTLETAALLAVLSGAALVLRWPRTSPFDVLLWLAFGFLALSAVRNLALFAIVTAPLVTRNLGPWLAGRRVGPGLRRAADGAGLAALAGLTALHVAFLLRAPSGLLAPPRGPLLTPQYAMEAVDWIERRRPPGPLYHRLGDGGYLIWRLYPDYHVMVDGRLEVYGAERFVELELRSGLPEGFQALDRRHHFGTALLHHALLPGLELLRFLHARDDWRLVHLDEVAAVFVRLGPSGELPWPAIDPGGPDVFEPVPADDRTWLGDWRRRSQHRVLEALRGQP